MAISISVLGLILSTHLSSYLPINFYSFPAFLLVKVQSFIKKTQQQQTNKNRHFHSLEILCVWDKLLIQQLQAPSLSVNLCPC